MNKTELMQYAEENGPGSYNWEWEEESWFEELTEDKDVVMAMLKMSDALCFLEGSLQTSEFKKHKDMVLYAIEIYRAFISDEEEAYQLWDLSDESLADDQDIVNAIGMARD